MRKSLKSKISKDQSTISNNSIKKPNVKKNSDKIISNFKKENQLASYLNTSCDKNNLDLKEIEDTIGSSRMIKTSEEKININSFNEKYLNSEVQNVNKTN